MNTLGMALTLALLALTLLHYSSLVGEVKKVEARAKAYLCLRHVVEKTRSQLTTQNRYDFAIRLLNKALVLAVLKPELLASLQSKKKWVIRSSHLSYASFLTRLTPIKWCGLRNAHLVFRTPFQTKGMIMARSRQGTSLRKPRWSFTVKAQSFSLKGGFREGRKKGKRKWNIQEIKGGIF